MPKLRKMLGDVNAKECLDLMQLIETQSVRTLATWAVGYAKNNYLWIYEDAAAGDLKPREAVTACEEYLKGHKELKDIKPVIKEAAKLGREVKDPAAQAVARAVATACAAVQTPTSTLGFLFYGAAALAYKTEGLDKSAVFYEGFACAEFKKALDSLRLVSVPGEKNPAKIRWNC